MNELTTKIMINELKKLVRNQCEIEHLLGKKNYFPGRRWVLRKQWTNFELKIIELETSITNAI
ncbi:MAG TPA: hypothetical protein PLN81_07890 [Bacillota bacterium]|mgnify:CR=1 FL=1|jgi:hypothetical protein|nr:hypothetical protein [Bacillota bacterium]